MELPAIEDPTFHRLLDSAQHGTRAARQMVGEAIALANACLTLVAAGSVLAFLHPVLLPLLLTIAAPKGWGAIRTARKRYISTMVWLQHTRASAVISELLTDPLVAPEVRVHGAGSFLLQQLENMSIASEAEQTRLARDRATTDIAAAALSGMATIITYLILGLLLSSSTMDLAVAGTAVLAIRTGAANITTFVTQLNNIYREALFLQDLENACVEGDRRAIPIGGKASCSAPEKIRLRNVAFSYPGNEKCAVDGISLSINRGQIVAFVGENGSGKTTVAKLLAGLYQPCAGTVEWDTVDIQTLNRDQLFSHVGILSQDF
ncbi:ATP-binding cassette domain-containing protein, partial [Streptomyces cinereoruber]|uniref:ATP-binding cassette domain-containing protein n=1 Tax=Streptomyces cinereoruber TaxID=67260 RepID=UPI00362D275D